MCVFTLELSLKHEALISVTQFIILGIAHCIRHICYVRPSPGVCTAALLISVVMKIKFFWVVMPFVTISLGLLNPAAEGTKSFDISGIIYQLARCNISEDLNLHHYRCEDLKFRNYC